MNSVEAPGYIPTDLARASNPTLYEPYPFETQAGYPQLGNQELPVWERREEITEAMINSRVLILVSPTGTGKSTQLPQYALQAGFDRIIQTQPRRSAAENIHNRVGSELGAVLGAEAVSELVSFHTGGGREGSLRAPIDIVTDGLLVARDAYEARRPGTVKWILDEIHEDNANMWLLLGLAKQRLQEDPTFSLVITTATADKYKYVNFFATEDEEPAVIELESRMHYVEYREEPESGTVREAIKAAIDIHNNPDQHDGSNTIVIFEAGKNEIKDTIDELHKKLPAEILAQATILKGHAKMSSKDLAPIYEEMPGIKIVVQTNMGKTSHTIPGVRYVISSGRERQEEIDDRDDSALVEYDSSQDCIVQEMGRAGRTNTGIFILTRGKNRHFVGLNERQPHLTPEILRTRIDNHALYLAMRGDSIMDFPAITPIPEVRKARSLQRLQAMGALDAEGLITPLGMQMVKYPLSPERARAMVEAEKHAAAIRLYMAAMTASAQEGGLRLFEPGGTRNWESLSSETSSDALAQLDIFVATQDMSVEDMQRHDIDVNNVNRARQMVYKIAKRAGVTDVPKLLPPSGAERELLRECLAAGYINSVYLPEGGGFFRKLGATALPERELSNRSVVSEFTTHPVIGEARNVVLFKHGHEEVKPIIEDATEVPREIIRRLGVSLAQWVHTGFTLRNGKFVEKQTQVFGPLTLDSREVPAQPSPQLRDRVIQYVKTDPGKHLRNLYSIKSELERLAHRAKYPIPRLTEDMIDKLIEQAAPEAVNDPSHVDDNLRKIIRDRTISLNQFVSQKERAKILRDSPDEVRISDVRLKLWYRQGKVYARSYKKDWIGQLDETVPPMLPDGREIFFYHDKKKYNLRQLKKVLQDEHWI